MDRNILIILFIINIYFTLCSGRMSGYKNRRCDRHELVEVAECNKVHYNYTQMPNLLGHESQMAAKLEFHTYSQLLQMPCSSMFNLLLCSVYFPMCDTRSYYLMGPCRSLCELVKIECSPLLNKLNYKWPESLDCEIMGDENNGDICIHPPSDVIKRIDTPTSEGEDLIRVMYSENMNVDSVPMDMFGHLDNATFLRLKKWIDYEKTKSLDSDKQKTEEVTLEKDLKLIQASLKKCGHLKNTLAYVHINVTNSCVPLCQSNVFFTKESKAFGQISAYILALVCILFCLLTIISFLRSSKLRPCERPILYIAGCKLVYSIVFVVAYNIGRIEITCGPDFESEELIRLNEGMNNSNCALTFLMQFFFNSASRIWQTFLVVNWLLHMNHKFNIRNSQQITNPQANRISSCLQFFCLPKLTMSNTTFLTNQKISTKQKRIYEDINMQKILAKEHIFAWLIPGIACVVVLVTRRVDADELLGICGIGNQHQTAFKFLQMLPNIFLTIISLLLIFYGILLMTNRLGRSPKEICKDSTTVIKFNQLDSLSIRTSLFCTFLVIPSIFLCIVDGIQYQNLSYWQNAQNPILEFDKPSVVLLNMLENEKPSSEWFILRNFMENIIGISCGLWTLAMHHRLIDHFYMKFEKKHSLFDEAPSGGTTYRPNETASTNVSAYAFYEKRNDGQSTNVDGHSKSPIMGNIDVDSSSNSVGYYYSNDKMFSTSPNSGSNFHNPFMNKTSGNLVDTMDTKVSTLLK